VARKSDKPNKVNRTREQRISATEASRSFSKILDEVESGRRFLVHRRGHDACVMAPPPVAGRRASEVLGYLRSRSPVVLDDRFGADLLDILKGEPAEEQPAWDS
jgi:antitoxin (DNA-binding transcriptional repressor) of toxin-antitoxin stability system